MVRSKAANVSDECASTACSTPMSWMVRLKWVFTTDLSRCANCGGELQVIGAITDPGLIARILKHVGLDGCVLPRAPSSVVTN